MNNKPLAKFKGPELLEFVNEIPRIQSFLSLHFPQDEQSKNIVEVLGLWHDIVPFLSIKYVPNINEYRSELTKFESNLNKRYLFSVHYFCLLIMLVTRRTYILMCLNFIYLR